MKLRRERKKLIKQTREYIVSYELKSKQTNEHVLERSLDAGDILNSAHMTIRVAKSKLVISNLNQCCDTLQYYGKQSLLRIYRLVSKETFHYLKA